MRDQYSVGLCRYLKAKPSELKQSLLSGCEPATPEPETPSQASPNLYKRRRRPNRRRRGNRYGAAGGPTTPKPARERYTPRTAEEFWTEWIDRGPAAAAVYRSENENTQWSAAGGRDDEWESRS